MRIVAVFTDEEAQRRRDMIGILRSLRSSRRGRPLTHTKAHTEKNTSRKGTPAHWGHVEPKVHRELLGLTTDSERSKLRKDVFHPGWGP